MTFTKKTWKARLGTGLNKFSIDGALPVSLMNTPDTVTQTGDAFSEQNMNDLENRIFSGFQDIHVSGDAIASIFHGGAGGVSRTSGTGWYKGSSIPTGTDYLTYNGYLNATRVYGGVYNDYAEYRVCKQTVLPGICVEENGDGSVRICKKKFSKTAKVVTDTFGMSIGHKEQSVPVALCGRVMACPEKGYHPKVGDVVGCSKNGKLQRMCKLRQLLSPLSILGVVSEIPIYKKWNEIKVDERIWLEIRR